MSFTVLCLAVYKSNKYAGKIHLRRPQDFLRPKKFPEGNFEGRGNSRRAEDKVLKNPSLFDCVDLGQKFRQGAFNQVVTFIVRLEQP